MSNLNKHFIYIRLGDPFFEEVFNQRFSGFVVEKDDHTVTIRTEEFLEYISEIQAKKWREEIDKIKKDRLEENS